MPFPHERVPHLAKTDYGHAGVLRYIVAHAIDYAHVYRKGFENDVPEDLSRPLRRFFDGVNAKFPNWSELGPNAKLEMPEYPAAMRLSRAVDLACRHARLFPSSQAAIKTFFTLVPDFIQKIADDPEVPEPEFTLELLTSIPEWQNPQPGTFDLTVVYKREGVPLTDIAVGVQYSSPSYPESTTHRRTGRAQAFSTTWAKSTDDYMDLHCKIRNPDGSDTVATKRYYRVGKTPVPPADPKE